MYVCMYVYVCMHVYNCTIWGLYPLGIPAVLTAQYKILNNSTVLVFLIKLPHNICLL